MLKNRERKSVTILLPLLVPLILFSQYLWADDKNNLTISCDTLAKVANNFDVFAEWLDKQDQVEATEAQIDDAKRIAAYLQLFAKNIRQDARAEVRNIGQRISDSIDRFLLALDSREIEALAQASRSLAKNLRAYLPYCKQN